MHLIVMIALGVFGGLWLFTRWIEWREVRMDRKLVKHMRREARRMEMELNPAAAIEHNPDLHFGSGMVVLCIAVGLITLMAMASP
jgi:hypothetical protein